MRARAAGGKAPGGERRRRVGGSASLAPAPQWPARAQKKTEPLRPASAPQPAKTLSLSTHQPRWPTSTGWCPTLPTSAPRSPGRRARAARARPACGGASYRSMCVWIEGCEGVRERTRRRSGRSVAREKRADWSNALIFCFSPPLRLAGDTRRKSALLHDLQFFTRHATTAPSTPSARRTRAPWPTKSWAARRPHTGRRWPPAQCTERASRRTPSPAGRHHRPWPQ